MTNAVQQHRLAHVVEARLAAARASNPVRVWIFDPDAQRYSIDHIVFVAADDGEIMVAETVSADIDCHAGLIVCKYDEYVAFNPDSGEVAWCEPRDWSDPINGTAGHLLRIVGKRWVSGIGEQQFVCEYPQPENNCQLGRPLL